jgi:hypothetical protein
MTVLLTSYSQKVDYIEPVAGPEWRTVLRSLKTAAKQEDASSVKRIGELVTNALQNGECKVWGVAGTWTERRVDIINHVLEFSYSRMIAPRWATLEGKKTVKVYGEVTAK